MNIAKSIRVGMAKCEMDQLQIQAVLCVSDVTTSRWVNGRAKPNLERIEALASLFGVKVSEFIKWGE